MMEGAWKSHDLADDGWELEEVSATYELHASKRRHLGVLGAAVLVVWAAPKLGDEPTELYVEKVEEFGGHHRDFVDEQHLVRMKCERVRVRVRVRVRMEGYHRDLVDEHHLEVCGEGLGATPRGPGGAHAARKVLVERWHACEVMGDPWEV